jgi:hypothetical protein
MFAADSLCECNFVLEFNLPKEISSNQDYIKLSVNHIDLPTVEIPSDDKTHGQIYCIEFYENIKDKLHLLEKWLCALYDKIFGWSNDSLYIDAKLHGYNKDGELTTSWLLHRFYPNFYPTKFENHIDFQFGFAHASTI